MLRWVDERTGLITAIRHFLDEKIPGGARMHVVFGSVLVFLFMLQAVTGLVLASVYSPSTNNAWASVAFIQTSLRLGWFVRGLHSVGASAIVIACLVHLCQVALFGAYKKPREVNWLSGLALFGLVFAFALTGYLLPWDQKGYWATQVATNLAGAIPLVGGWLKQLVQGGPEYGHVTLTHFFTLHAIFLPAVTLLLIVGHVALMRRHGVTPSWRASPTESQPFYPNQLARDLGAMLLAVAGIIFIVWWRHGTDLEAPADPGAAYDARPEWYFRPLFEMLKFVPGELEWVAALLVPGAAVLALASVPFWDRGGPRPRERWKPLGLILLILIGAGALGLRSVLADAHDAAYQKGAAAAKRQAEVAIERAQGHGVPPSGDPFDRGEKFEEARQIFSERCASCHQLEGMGRPDGPELDGLFSRAFIRDFLLAPSAPRFFGRTKIHGMKPVKERGRDLEALTEWVYAQSGAADVDAKLRDEGAELFDKSGCSDCHSTDGTSDDEGPNLGGIGSRAWLSKLISDASRPQLFGQKNTMPKFGAKLDAAQLDKLADYLYVVGHE
jgi:ubiquinol-cytochrome c reductase cytochrome b subunit